MDRLTDAVELLDGPLDDPTALAGNLRDLRRINRWLGGVRVSSAAIDAARGASRGAVPARRRDRRRRHPGRAARRGDPARPDAPRSSGSTTVPRCSRRPSAPHRRSAATGRPHADGRGRALAALPGSLVRRRPRLARPPPPRRRRGSAAARARWAASRGSGSSSTTSTGAGSAWLGAWLIGHLLTGNRYTRHDAPLSVRRAYRRRRGASMLVRAAGLAPVRSIRGPLPASLRDRRGPADRAPICPGPGGHGWHRRDRVEVAIVGGGPAGATLATRLARTRPRGRRPRAAPTWHWRAGGVFASPAAVVGAARASDSIADDAGGGRPADPGDARRDARAGRRSG